MGAYTVETMTMNEWKNAVADTPIMAFESENGDVHDYTEYTAEIQMVHNDVDGDNAGRSKTKGARMQREYLSHKHTFNVRLVNGIPQIVAHEIFQLIHTTDNKTSFYMWHQGPCGNTVTRRNVYCSTINYGAQRYDRQTKKCCYDGMNFNLIEM